MKLFRYKVIQKSFLNEYLWWPHSDKQEIAADKLIVRSTTHIQ